MFWRRNEGLAVTAEQPALDKARARQALEASIHIGLAFLLVAACLLILLPFIPLIAWGIIIAVALHPDIPQAAAASGRTWRAGRGSLYPHLYWPS